MSFVRDALHCELCDQPMSLLESAHSPVRYFHCARCGRWVASNYGDDLIRAKTAGVSEASTSAAARKSPQDFDRIKERLTRFLANIDDNDPFRTLGLPPSSSPEAIRTRFCQLAMHHHPDRGGDVAQMQRIVNAYERIQRAPPTRTQESRGSSAPGVPVRVAPRRPGACR